MSFIREKIYIIFDEQCTVYTSRPVQPEKPYIDQLSELRIFRINTNILVKATKRERERRGTKVCFKTAPECPIGYPHKLLRQSNSICVTFTFFIHYTKKKEEDNTAKNKQRNIRFVFLSKHN